MLEIVAKSGYTGPLAVQDHCSDMNAEENLKQNLEGLAKLVREMST